MGRRFRTGEGDKMYEVLLAVKSPSIIRELKKLRIWGEPTGFRIRGTVEDFDQLIPRLQEFRYDLLFLENLSHNQTVTLLRKIKNENLCCATAIVCGYVDFNTVRKSFLLGADDFFVTPFEADQLFVLFSKIRNKDHGNAAGEICQKEVLMELFENQDFSIRERLDEVVCRALTQSRDLTETSAYLKRIIDSVIQDLFEKYQWLDYYFDKNEYLAANCESLDLEKEIRRNIEDFYSFFVEFTELYPSHGENLEKFLQYILCHPEADLRQKTIAEELYINRTYLSTLFTAQVEVSYVDYVNIVKMKRAAWLLKHTKMKVIDIAGILDFKDMGYFLKRFKAKYGVTPSQYRIPENYEFHI